MSSSHTTYTIDVSECRDNNVRDIALKQLSSTCFSVTHRGVLWAFIANFSYDGEEGEQKNCVGGYGTRLSRNSTHIPIDPLNIYGEKTKDLFTCGSNESGLDNQNEYLCVFHREELQDMCGRYSVTFPQTICSSYSVPSGTSTHFVLHNVQPSSVSMGVSGIFVHGELQSPSSYPVTLESNGETFRRTADLWWMSSPLCLTPVYTPLVSAYLMGSAPPVSTEQDEAQQFIEASQASNVDFDGLSGLPASPFRSPGSSRSSKSNRINAVVLHQFVHYHNSDSKKRVCFAVAKTHDNEIQLALTEPISSYNVMTWKWCPQRLKIAGLSMNKNSLSVVASEHPSLTHQALFLYDSKSEIVYILRTFNLSTGEGDLQLMTILNCQSGFPTVVPCLRKDCPQPILLCNYPTANDVTFFNPYAISRKVESNFILSSFTNLPAHFAFQTKKKFVASNESIEYRSSDARDVLEEIGEATNEENTWIPSASIPEKICGIQYQKGNVVVFSSQTSGVNPPLQTCAENRQGVHTSKSGNSCVVEEEMKADMTSYLIKREGTGEEKKTISSNFQDESKAEEKKKSTARRKCEVTIEQTVEFPSLELNSTPFLHYTLEALEASLGREKVYELDFFLFQRICEVRRSNRVERKRGTGRVEETQNKNAENSYTKMFSSLLTEVVHNSLKGEYTENGNQSNTAKPNITNQEKNGSLGEKMLVSLLNPLQISANTINTFCAEMNKGKTVGSQSVPSDAHPKHSTSIPSWSANECFTCLFTLHLLYESFKMQERLWSYMEDLAKLIFAIASTLGCFNFAALYEVAEDLEHSNSKEVARRSTAATNKDTDWQLNQKVFLLHEKLLEVVQNNDSGLKASPDLLNYLVKTECMPPSLFLTIRDMLYKMEEHTILFPMLQGLHLSHPISVLNRLYSLYADCFYPMNADVTEEVYQSETWWHCLIEGLQKYHLCDLHVLENLSVGIMFPIFQALSYGKERPNEKWNQELLFVVGRLDCIKDKQVLQRLSQPGQSIVRTAEEHSGEQQEYRVSLIEDVGVNMRSDFNKTWTDSRLDNVEAIFNTSAPLLLPGQGDGSEALYNTLAILSRRARALPIGRGIFTMCTQNFRVRDNIPIPVLNMDGRTGDGVTVKNNLEEVLPDRMLWPVFHNGCAAGFRFFPNDNIRSAADRDSAATVTRHWIVHQIQSRDTQSPAARAGLLLAAGVLGHLKTFQLTDIYTLLVSPQPQFSWREVTTISVMVGLACSFRGTNNELVFNCLSMHIQSLTPSVEEIEVSLDVQTSALVSIGLLCQRTLTNGFLIEMLLIEMSRLPSDEHCINREGYVLGAGFSLGLLLLGLGSSHGSHSHIEDRLLSFMVGAKRQPVPSAREGLENFKELYGYDSGHFFTQALLNQSVQESSRCLCTKVNEGNYYNVNISGPAAVMALGFMYLKTNNRSIARRLLPTDRVASLQEISPILCLLRSMMAGVIEWNSVSPNAQWLRTNTPSSVVELMTSGTVKKLGLAQQQIHYIQINIGHCIAGAVMALGLRFAGSFDADARTTILAELNGFIKGQIGSTGINISVLQKSANTYESCISACAVALSLVMAGSGDLKIFSIFQKLLKRGAGTPYSSHQAISMALGLLFLGGGRLTLSNSTDAIAALIISLYPVWPEHPEDNVYHLQALRHLYGLAVVPRVLDTVDAVTFRPVSVPIRIVLRKGRVVQDSEVAVRTKAPIWTPVPRGKEEQEVRLTTPCLYPPPEMIERIEVRSAQHYPVTISREEGTITHAGLRIRVLEHHKNVEGFPENLRSATTVERCSTIEEARRRPFEAHVMDWLKYLFESSTQTTASLAILDNLKLLFAAVQVCAPIAQSSRNDVLISADFSKSVVSALDRRYGFLFFKCDEKGGRTCFNAREHPIYQLVVNRMTIAALADFVSKNPHGTQSFPCDFTSFASSTMHALEGKDQNSTDLDSVASAGLDLNTLKLWLAEAIRYFGLDHPRLSKSLLDYTTETKNASKSEKFVRLLQLHRFLNIPFDTLQKAAHCCD